MERFFEDPWVPAAIAAGVVLALFVAGVLWRRLRSAPPTRELERAPEPGPGAAASREPEGLVGRLRLGLARTSERLGSGLSAALRRGRVDRALLEELEELLIGADVGVRATGRILAGLEERAARTGATGPAALLDLLAEQLRAVFAGLDAALAEAPPGEPLVVLVVGVNGSGKTTTIGKLAARFARQGRSVLIGAGDTYRAGAIEQLRIWADRAGADFVAHQEGADPAAVLYDAMKAAKARGIDVVICDTAGRLQSRRPLMEQLAKVRRVLARGAPGAPHEVLLVLDGTTGQNAVQQARVFGEVAGVTGIVLTKLDGTAKGGIVAAVADELGLPVKFIGVGESVDDLRPFEAAAFVEAILGGGRTGA